MSAFVELKGIQTTEISTSSIYRAQLRIRYSLKGVTRISARQDPVEAVEFFQAVQHVHEDQILNIDAANTASGEKLKERMGRAEKGHRAVKYEMNFRGVPWCFVAIYSTFGFLDWHFFEGTGFDHKDISHFLESSLRAFFVDGNIVVLDNASNNKHGKSVAALEEIMQGNFISNAPYQHYYAPIERGFSNVMCEVRLREDQAMISPRIVIEEAFMKYSVMGSHGHVDTPSYSLINMYLPRIIISLLELNQQEAIFSVYAQNHKYWLFKIDLDATDEVKSS